MKQKRIIKNIDKKEDKHIIKKKKLNTNKNLYSCEHLQIEGRNHILEALKSNRYIDKIFIKKGMLEGSIKIILAKAREKGIVIVELSNLKLNQMSKTNNHQGIIAICPIKEYVEVENILNFAKDKKEDPFIIILDGIKDPHNLGAIIRTANASGVHGIIIPKRRAVGLTPIVGKTSAGAVENIKVAKVTNIVKIIEDLKNKGIWIVAGELNGRECYNVNLKGPIALVIGSEGKGIGKLISKKIDFSVKIPMYGEISSLNASVAASVLMYEVVRQRKFI